MDKLSRADISELLQAVGDHLDVANAPASIVVVGGGSLAFHGWVDRTTRDVDVIAQAIRDGKRRMLVAPDPLPAALVEAVERVARDYGLPRDWLNTTIGAQWPYGLPDGFLQEIQWQSFGGLEVGFAGRRSLIALKLFAAVDRGPESVHSQDLIRLSPSDAELEDAMRWVVTQDSSDAFPGLLAEVIAHVRSALRRDRSSS
jgi:hypothetical protein